MVVVAAICLSCSSNYVANDSANDFADDCDSTYLELSNRVKRSSEIVDKEKYLMPLEKALQLCKEGKKEEASKIVDDLKAQARRERLLFGR